MRSLSLYPKGKESPIWTFPAVRPLGPEKRAGGQHAIASWGDGDRAAGGRVTRVVTYCRGPVLEGKAAVPGICCDAQAVDARRCGARHRPAPPSDTTVTLLSSSLNCHEFPTSATATARSRVWRRDRCCWRLRSRTLLLTSFSRSLSVSAMSWLTLHRADVSRRASPATDRVASRDPGLGEVRHRHPAMAGLNVSPVHGRHCICERCAREMRKHD